MALFYSNLQKLVFIVGALLAINAILACSPVDDDSNVCFGDECTTDGSIINGETGGNQSPPSEIDPNSDKDKDGLTYAEEEQCGSSPDLQDTDGDGLLDQAECETHHTSPVLIDTDLDGQSDFYEVATADPPTDPLNPDNDNDGYHPNPDSLSATEAENWPSEADCNNADATVYPGAPDEINGYDTDCQIDVLTDSFVMPKGYEVIVEYDAVEKGVWVTARFAEPTDETIGCNGDFVSVYDSGECLVDPFLTAPSNPCDVNTSATRKTTCQTNGDDEQPYVTDHSCFSWDSCAGAGCDVKSLEPNDACANFSINASKGYKVTKLYQGMAYEIEMIGRRLGSGGSGLKRGFRTLRVGE